LDDSTIGNIVWQCDWTTSGCQVGPSEACLGALSIGNEAHVINLHKHDIDLPFMSHPGYVKTTPTCTDNFSTILFQSSVFICLAAPSLGDPLVARDTASPGDEPSGGTRVRTMTEPSEAVVTAARIMASLSSPEECMWNKRYSQLCWMSHFR